MKVEMSTRAVEILHIPAEQYHAIPALSYSGMKDLAVSPLRYWYLHINPNRPKDEPTKYQDFGSAVHCAVLEPNRFDERYVCAIDEGDIEGCLRTMDDLRWWLKQRVVEPKGKHKADLIKQVQGIDPNWPILEVLEAEHAEQHKGKTEFKKTDWFRIGAAANALRTEPALAKVLASNGQTEVSFLVTHPDTGVKLKARMDWISDEYTVDPKTFSVTRGKSVDQAVNDAIYYERYHWQARLYALVRSLASGDKSRAGSQKAPEHIIPFVESEEPHEVRVRSLRPVEAGGVNMLWERARFETDALINLYAECWRKYGDRPWREAREIDPVESDEFPQLAFS